MTTAPKIKDPRLKDWQNAAINMDDRQRMNYAEHLQKVARMILRTACVGCHMASKECPDRCARAEAWRESV